MKSIFKNLGFRRSKSKFIYIFLNNKIISLDTIVPIILDVKSRNETIKVIYITFDYNTYEFIKLNKLLFKAIKEVGDLILLGRYKNSKYFNNKNIGKYHYKRLNFIIHLAKILPHFLALIYNLITTKVIFIHFRALNTWPLKLLYYFNKNNTIFSSADSSGYSEQAYNADRSVHEQRTDLNKFLGPSPKGKSVIAFSNNWPLLKHPALLNSKKYIIRSSHSRKTWIDYLKSNFNNLIKEETNVELTNDCCLLLLGHIGQEASGAMFLKNKNSWTTLVEDILDIIHEECPQFKILIKPHIITDMSLLQSILNKRKNLNVIITSLHPALLSVKTRFSIASHYTTAFQSIHDIGGITIEYTDQKEKYRKKLNYKSKRPEYTTYFFNNDEQGFRSLLKDIRNNKVKSELKRGYDDDPSNLLNYLSE
ncbi:MAG: hypothetical protein CMJ11_05490 [Pelagibacterales bacterium]|nr:hypothetical protein [Pelagibacterales bacterium]